MKGSAWYYTSMEEPTKWHQVIYPTQKLAQVGEVTLRLARIALYQKLRQAENQLSSMGLPNNISDVFLKSSADMLNTGFKKAEFTHIRVDTTPNSVF